MEPLSYARSGVDLARAKTVKERITRAVESTFGPDVLRPLGFFGGFFAAPGSSGTLALVATIDSVGTKVLLAITLGRHYGIGVDLVHHSANDLLACGAQPLFFLDYFAAASLEESILEELVHGMTDACRALHCSLIGGETAQLPGIYQSGTYDLAGCMVGVVSTDRIIDGRHIAAGDLVLGLPSSGLHTNGYTLARACLGLTGERERDWQILSEIPVWSQHSLGELLLEPHRCYYPLLRPWLGHPGLHGLAHITGGGLVENIARIIPQGRRVEIDATTWTVPPLFLELQQRGQVPLIEMYRVFNMGIGFVVIGEARFIRELQQAIGEGWIIGQVTEGDTPRVLVRLGTDPELVLTSGS